MKKIKFNLSADVMETADELAAKMGIHRNALLSFCIEGSTYLYGKAKADKPNFLPKRFNQPA